MPLNNNVMWKYPSEKLVVQADNLMVTISCPPQILVVSDNRKALFRMLFIWIPTFYKYGTVFILINSYLR